MIYLDNNSTTQIDPEVLEAMLPVMQKHYGNASNKSHAMGWYAAELVEIAREQVASIINAKTDEIIFTSGATESNNMALKGFLLKDPSLLSAITSSIEHNSILNTFSYLESCGLEVSYSPVNKDGLLHAEITEQIEKANPSLVSLMLANNEIGTIQNLSAIFNKTKSLKIISHTDATQAVGKIAIDVNSLNADLLSFSSHKIYGPKGVGALYISKDCPEITPLIHGGGQEYELRSGTANVAGIVGFGKACEIAKRRLEQDSAKLNQLSNLFLETFKNNFSDIKINGCTKNRIPGNLNFVIKEVDHSKLLAALSTKVAFSISSACQSTALKPSHVLKAIGLDNKEKRSSIRIGLGRFNTEQEVTEAAKIISEYCKKPEAKLSRG